MSPKRPPLGVRLTVDIEEVRAPRGTVWWARVRWHDPESGRRESVKRSHFTHEAAATWIAQMQNASRTGVDATLTLAEYVTFIGDRWTRGIGPTSTYDPYSAGLRRRVLPTLGHLPVGMITAGLVDGAIDQWETEFGRSTIKNTVSALVLVLNEAVRDGIIPRNPATDRARRRTVGRSSTNSDPRTPRDLALPSVVILERLVARVVEAGKDQSWGDVVTILATTALRISEVSGLCVGDIDLVRGLIHVHRQTYPGRGGLVTKETKGPSAEDGADR